MYMPWSIQEIGKYSTSAKGRGTGFSIRQRWSHQIYNINMKIEEAIVYVMVKRNGGMTTDQIADAINRQGLHQRKDGQPVTSKQVYATICRFPEMFTKEADRIMLTI